MGGETLVGRFKVLVFYRQEVGVDTRWLTGSFPECSDFPVMEDIYLRPPAVWVLFTADIAERRTVIEEDSLL